MSTKKIDKRQPIEAQMEKLILKNVEEKLSQVDEKLKVVDTLEGTCEVLGKVKDTEKLDELLKREGSHAKRGKRRRRKDGRRYQRRKK